MDGNVTRWRKEEGTIEGQAVWAVIRSGVASVA